METSLATRQSSTPTVSTSPPSCTTAARARRRPRGAASTPAGPATSESWRGLSFVAGRSGSVISGRVARVGRGSTPHPDRTPRPRRRSLLRAGTGPVIDCKSIGRGFESRPEHRCSGSSTGRALPDCAHKTAAALHTTKGGTPMSYLLQHVRRPRPRPHALCSRRRADAPEPAGVRRRRLGARVRRGHLAQAVPPRAAGAAAAPADLGLHERDRARVLGRLSGGTRERPVQDRHAARRPPPLPRGSRRGGRAVRVARAAARAR